MSQATDIDVSLLEQIYEQTSDSSREDIHLMCYSPRNHDQHVVCGAEDTGEIVPEWVEINCADCLKIEEPAMHGAWARCRVCGEEFKYDDEE